MYTDHKLFWKHWSSPEVGRVAGCWWASVARLVSTGGSKQSFLLLFVPKSYFFWYIKKKGWQHLHKNVIDRNERGQGPSPNTQVSCSKKLNGPNCCWLVFIFSFFKGIFLPKGKMKSEFKFFRNMTRRSILHPPRLLQFKWRLSWLPHPPPRVTDRPLPRLHQQFTWATCWKVNCVQRRRAETHCGEAVPQVVRFYERRIGSRFSLVAGLDLLHVNPKKPKQLSERVDPFFFFSPSGLCHVYKVASRVIQCTCWLLCQCKYHIRKSQGVSSVRWRHVGEDDLLKFKADVRGRIQVPLSTVEVVVVESLTKLLLMYNFQSIYWFIYFG